MTCAHWEYVLDFHTAEVEELGRIGYTLCRNCGEIVRAAVLPGEPN